MYTSRVIKIHWIPKNVWSIHDEGQRQDIGVSAYIRRKGDLAIETNPLTVINNSTSFFLVQAKDRRELTNYMLIRKPANIILYMPDYLNC